MLLLFNCFATESVRLRFVLWVAFVLWYSERSRMISPLLPDSNPGWETDFSGDHFRSPVEVGWKAGKSFYFFWKLQDGPILSANSGAVCTIAQQLHCEHTVWFKAVKYCIPFFRMAARLFLLQPRWVTWGSPLSWSIEGPTRKPRTMWAYHDATVLSHSCMCECY